MRRRTSIAAELQRFNDREERKLSDSPERRAEMEAARNPMKPVADILHATNIPALAMFFRAENGGKDVPPEHWAADGADVAQVQCPSCGEGRTLERGVPINCECHRTFLFTGLGVRVAYWRETQTPAAS